MNFKGATAVLATMAVIVGLGSSSAEADEQPPSVVLGPGSFTDDNGSIHESSIEALAAAGITLGCNPPDNDHYCPTTPTTHAEMATFLTRALDLPATSNDYFTDDNGSIHESSINALAAAGITLGCNPPDNDHYCPTTPTTHAEMATFLTRALDLPATSNDYFTDDNGSIHESSINALAAAGITLGCNPPDNDRYCPQSETTRAQMATFLVRGLGFGPPELWALVHDAVDDPIPGSSSAGHLAYGDVGYVAAGPVLAINDDAAIWTSPDGVDWAYVPNTAGLFGGPGNAIAVSDVASGNTAMVAVGNWRSSNSSIKSDAAVWRSEDRVTWARVADSRSAFGTSGDNSLLMNAVSFDPALGFVAVGSEALLDGQPGMSEESVAAVWESSDGVDWARVPTDSALEGGKTLTMNDVVAANGLVVAIGTDYSTNSPAFWWSSDAQTWTRTSDPSGLPPLDSLSIEDITAGAAGFVAVAYEAIGETRAPVSYTSADGKTWARHALAVEGTLSAVTYDGSAYVAVGSGSTTLHYPAAIWESEDGVTWQRRGERTSGPTSRWLQTVVAAPAGLLVGGTQTPEHTNYGAIWLRP